MAVGYICDECGKPAVTGMTLATYHFYVDERQVLDVAFCEDHAPVGKFFVGQQPNNCSRVRFYYPEAVKPSE